MKVLRWTILILLLLALLCGVAISDPLVRFTADLSLERFNAAQAVYLSYPYMQSQAAQELGRFVEWQYDIYARQELSHGGVMDILEPLSETELPQDDIQRCLRAVADMEAARADLMQADAAVTRGDYAQAIPLFRQSLMADELARYRLEQAEARYLDQILSQAISSMDDGEYEKAEKILLEGQSVLGASEDLSDALIDVRRMADDQTIVEYESEARRLLIETGPETAFRYVAELREQAPDAYGLEYLEQMIRHEYEADICARASALRDSGDPLAACALLEEGGRWIESAQIRALHAEIMSVTPFPLSTLPIARDETADPRTEAESTVVWDRVLQDSHANAYEHSLYADVGTLSFSLQSGFTLFEGTVAFPAGERSDMYRSSATLQVFGDEKLIGEFKEMDSNAAPIPFRIPVEGVRELSLTWTSAGAGGWKDWGCFATIFDGTLLAAAD